MPQELTDEEMKLLDDALLNLSSAFWKETIPYLAKIRNHGIAREQIKVAYEQLKKIVEK